MDIYGIILPIDVHIFSSWLLHHQPVYIYNIYIYIIFWRLYSVAHPPKKDPWQGRSSRVKSLGGLGCLGCLGCLGSRDGAKKMVGLFMFTLW